MAPYILVVDDEPAIGKLLTYQLAGFGYRVSYLENGLLALQRLLAERPDLVLLDVMMPLISGWEVCRQIRACSDVPVIMLTAKSAESDIVQGFNAGADDYLTKPFNLTQLHARIEAVLRRAKNTASQVPQPVPVISFTTPAAAASGVTLGDVVLQATDQPPQPVQNGQQVHAARLAKGMTLHLAERACNVRWEFLQAIERENWEYIPRRELRRALNAYGTYLHLDLSPLHAQAQAQLRPYTVMRYAAVAVLIVVVVLGLYLL